MFVYTLQPTRRYKKSLKRLVRSGRFNFSELDAVINNIATGKSLDQKYDNHPLHGEYADCFECHIKSDLLLIYKIDLKTNTLVIINIGSHAELFE